MKLLIKIYYRLKREYRDLHSFFKSHILKHKLTEHDVVKDWETPNPNPTFKSCVAEWMEKNPCIIEKDFRSKKNNSFVQEAEKILKGQIEIFKKSVNLKIPDLWHTDPLTQNSWAKEIHYSRFSVFHPSKDGKTDIRRLWELGRFGWAISLARAYQETKNKKYAEAWKKFVTHFIEASPPEYGPHWLNAMEPAMRSIQWCRAFSIFIHADPNPFSLNTDFNEKFILALLQHGKYIDSHLEWTPSGRTNHYIADLVGLLTIAIFVPQSKLSKKWSELSKKELSREIEIQTDSDGFHSEASTAYHHFATELYTFVSALDHRHNLGFSSRFHGRVRRMIEVDDAIRGKENMGPRIGDDDSGPLFNETSDCVQSLEDLFPWKSQKKKNNLESFEFPLSGLYILRSENVSCFVSCGPNGQEGVGGHAHNDKLSFVLHHKGKPLMIDAGTCGYSVNIDLRNQFRSTKFHNTLTIDGREQNPLEDWRALADTTKAKKLSWEDSKTQTLFSGEHFGFQSIQCLHRRTFILSKNPEILSVTDEIETSNSHEVEWNLHLSPDIKKENVQIQASSITFPKIKISFESSVNCDLKEGIYSPVYGEVVNNLVLSIKMKIQGNIKFPWKIEFLDR
jgi:hypothetical protein